MRPRSLRSAYWAESASSNTSLRLRREFSADLRESPPVRGLSEVTDVLVGREAGGGGTRTTLFLSLRGVNAASQLSKESNSILNEG